MVKEFFSNLFDLVFSLIHLLFLMVLTIVMISISLIPFIIMVKLLGI